MERVSYGFLIGAYHKQTNYTSYGNDLFPKKQVNKHHDLRSAKFMQFRPPGSIINIQIREITTKLIDTRSGRPVVIYRVAVVFVAQKKIRLSRVFRVSTAEPISSRSLQYNANSTVTNCPPRKITVHLRYNNPNQLETSQQMTSVSLSQATPAQTSQGQHHQRQQHQNSQHQSITSPHHSPLSLSSTLTATNDRPISPLNITHFHQQQNETTQHHHQQQEQNQHDPPPHTSPLYALPPPLELSTLSSYVATSSQLRSLHSGGLNLNAVVEFLPPPPAPAMSPLSTAPASPSTSSTMLYSGGTGSYFPSSYKNSYMLPALTSKSSSSSLHSNNSYLSPTSSKSAAAVATYLSGATVDSSGYGVDVNGEDTRRTCQPHSLTDNDELDPEAETETEVISSEADETEDADAEQDDETDVDQINHDTDGDADPVDNIHNAIQEEDDSEEEEQYLNAPKAPPLMLKRQRQSQEVQQSGSNHAQHQHEKYVKFKSVSGCGVEKQAASSSLVCIEDGNSTDSDINGGDSKSKLLVHLRRGEGVSDILKLKGIKGSKEMGSKTGIGVSADDKITGVVSPNASCNSKRRIKKFISSGANMTSKQHEFLNGISTTDNHKLVSSSVYNKNELIDQRFLDHLNYEGLTNFSNSGKLVLGGLTTTGEAGTSMRCFLDQPSFAEATATSSEKLLETGFQKTKSLVTQIIRDAFKKSEENGAVLFPTNTTDSNSSNEIKKNHHTVYGRPSSSKAHVAEHTQQQQQNHQKLQTLRVPTPNLTTASALVPVLGSYQGNLNQQHTNDRDWLASQLMYLQMLDNQAQASTWALRGTLQNHHHQQDLDESKNTRSRGSQQIIERDEITNHEFKRKTQQLFKDASGGSERPNHKLSNSFNTNTMNFINQEEALELARTHLERFLMLSFEFLQNVTMTTTASIGRGSTMALPFDNPISRAIEQDVEQSFINNQQAIKCMVGTVDTLLEQCQAAEHYFQRALERHQQLEGNTTTTDALAIAAAASAVATSICPVSNRGATSSSKGQQRPKSYGVQAAADDDDEQDEEEYEEEEEKTVKLKGDLTDSSHHVVDTLCNSGAVPTSTSTEVHPNPIDYSDVSCAEIPVPSSTSGHHTDCANSWIAKQITIRPRTYRRLHFAAKRNDNGIEQFILRNASAIKGLAGSTPPITGGSNASSSTSRVAMQFCNQNINNSSAATPTIHPSLTTDSQPVLPLGVWRYEHINTLFQNKALSSAEIILECAAYAAQLYGSDPATAVTAVAAEISQVAEAARIAERAAVAAAAHVAADPSILTMRLGLQYNCGAINSSKRESGGTVSNQFSAPLTHSDMVIGEGSGCANASSPTQHSTAFAATFHPPPTPPPSSNNSNSSATPSPATAKNKRKSSVARRIETPSLTGTLNLPGITTDIIPQSPAAVADVNWTNSRNGDGDGSGFFLNRPPSIPVAANVAAALLRHQQQQQLKHPPQQHQQPESLQSRNIVPGLPTLTAHRHNKLQYRLDDANTPPAVLRDRALAEIIKARLSAFTVAAAATAGAGVSSVGTGATSAVSGIVTSGGVTDVPFDLSIRSKVET